MVRRYRRLVEPAAQLSDTSRFKARSLRLNENYVSGCRAALQRER